MSDTQITNFLGTEIEVQWDDRLCIHMAECGNAAGDLFVAGRDPWCVPDCCTKAEVKEIVERCPSGALTYRDKDGPAETPPAENTLSVTYNGPLFVTGDLVIEGAPADMPGVSYRAALCRCGASKNKPFCDNSHIAAGFEDFGSVGERGPGLTEKGGPLVIKPLPDGPLLIAGRLTIRAGSGRLAWQGDQVALCRCGASKNKPFCDGSHRSPSIRSVQS